MNFSNFKDEMEKLGGFRRPGDLCENLATFKNQRWPWKLYTSLGFAELLRDQTTPPQLAHVADPKFEASIDANFQGFVEDNFALDVETSWTLRRKCAALSFMSA